MASVVDSIFFIFMKNKSNENAICDIPVCLMLYYGIKYPHQVLIFALEFNLMTFRENLIKQRTLLLY